MGERESESYVHGYTEREHTRLVDQATTLSELLHHDTRYPPGARVLEAGCGVGAQTVSLARNSPDAQFVSIDLSAESLATARARVRDAAIKNVSFQQARSYFKRLHPNREETDDQLKDDVRRMDDFRDRSGL